MWRKVQTLPIDPTNPAVSRAVASVSSKAGTALTFLSGFWLFMGSFVLLYGSSSAQSNMPPYMVTAVIWVAVTIMMTIPGWFGCKYGMMLTDLQNRISRQSAQHQQAYLQLIQNKKSVALDEVARTLHLSFEQVCSDLELMLVQGILSGATVDREGRRLVKQLAGIQCGACGATTQVPLGEKPGCCEYCGRQL